MKIDKAAAYRQKEYKSKHGHIKREALPRVKRYRKKAAV